MQVAVGADVHSAVPHAAQLIGGRVQLVGKRRLIRGDVPPEQLVDELGPQFHGKRVLQHQLDVVDVGRIQEIADPEIFAIVGDVMQAEFGGSFAARVFDKSDKPVGVGVGRERELDLVGVEDLAIQRRAGHREKRTLQAPLGEPRKDILVVVGISVVERQQRRARRKPATALDRIDQVFHRNQGIVLLQVGELFVEQSEVEPLDLRKPGAGERTHIMVHHDRQFRLCRVR